MSDSVPPRLTTLVEFLRSGAAGGVLLMLSAVVALLWANSPGGESYEALFALPVGLSAGSHQVVMSLETWINDAVMAPFFLLVGLEIRHELSEGQLASFQRAAAPAFAALGGMVVPAVIYAAFAWQDPQALRGWAVPVATDIAFSLAVLRVLGRRVPAGLKVFLTALAIIDDLAAIAVIALFYTTQVDVAALIAALVLCAGLWGLGRWGVMALGPYMVGFVVLWALLARAGVHPTLAGVALAFLVPTGLPAQGEGPTRRLEHALNLWVAYLVLPLFGLANAGLRFTSLDVGMLTDAVVLGIVFGLCVGKPVGVFGATWLGCRLGLSSLPAQMTWRLLAGAALLCGIGFTMSLFIGHLAFDDPAHMEGMKAAVFAASLFSAVAGLAVLAGARHPSPAAVRVSPRSTG